MYKRILIATDGSELAGKAVDHGIALAQAVGASVVFVTVTQMWSAMEIAHDFEKGEYDAIKAYEGAAARSAELILQACDEKAATRGVEAYLRHVADARPADGILQTAELEDCDLIVMATHGHRGIKKVMVGSQTAEVVAASRRPVLVLR